MKLLMYLVLMFLRLYLIKDLIKMNGKQFVSEVYVKSAVVTIFAIITPLLLMFVMPDGLLRLITMCVVSALSTMVSVYIFGFTSDEKTMIVNFARNRIKSFYK